MPKSWWLQWFGQKPGRPRRPYRPAAEALEDRAVPAVFDVINNQDGAAGSLRQALINANNTAGPDTLTFHLPSYMRVIVPQSALPNLSDAGTTLDATTQPGYDALTGAPAVVIDGIAAAGTNVTGLTITGGNCTVKALRITRFGGNGILL